MSVPTGGREYQNTLAVFQQEDTIGVPLTTSEVADALDCARRTAYNRLEALVERSRLETKKVGARGRVWWLPAEDSPSTDVTDPLTEALRLPIDELFVQICDASPIGIAVVDPTHSIVFANDRLAEVLGRSKEDITSRTHSDSDWKIYDENGEPIPEETHPVTRVLRTGKPVMGFRHGITLPDGTERWLSSNSAPIRADDGTVHGVVVGLEDISSIKKHERHVESQRSELLRLNRVNATTRGVAQIITEAKTREDVETRVCELIANSEPYLFAVLGQFSSSYSDSTVRASAGIGDDYLDEILHHPDAPALDQGPGATAAKTREVQVVQNLTELRYEHWQEAAERNRFHSFASVPLVYDEVVYGVLGIYANQPVAFDTEEQALLKEMGEMIGYASQGIEMKKQLRSEQVVELTFKSEALARPFVDRGGDAFEMEGDGHIELDDGTILQYYTVKGISPKDGIEVFRQLSTEKVRLISTTAEGFEVEVHVSSERSISHLFPLDFDITSVAIEDGVLELSIELPQTADHDVVITRITERYPDMKLSSRQLVYTPQTLRELVETNLTDHQLMAAKFAHLSGYFEQPRHSTGEDLAAEMGVTPTTFHRHLRNAEKRIFDEVFDTSWTEETGT